MANMIPYAPRERFTQPNRLSDLILRAGEAQADAHLRSGQIWGNTIGKLGGIASGYVEDRAAQKQEQAKADALTVKEQAFFKHVEENGGKPDPKFLMRWGGPTAGPKLVQTAIELERAELGLSQDIEKSIATIAEGWGELSPNIQKAVWVSKLRPLAIKSGQFGGEQDLPTELTPEISEAIKSRAPKKDQKLERVEVRNPDGSTSIEFVEPKAGLKFTNAPEPTKPANLDLKETDKGLQTWDPRTGTLGPVVGQPRKTPQEPKPPVTFDQGGVRYQMNPDGTASPVPIKGGSAPSSPDPGENVFVNQPAYKSLTTKQKSQAVALDGLVKSLADYRELLDSTTDATGVNLVGKDAGRLRSRASKLKFSIAQAEETGALQKADAEIIGQMLGDPTDLTASVGNAMRGGKAAQVENVQALIADYDGKLRSMGLSSNKGPASNAAAAPTGSPKPSKGRLVQVNGIWKRVP